MTETEPDVYEKPETPINGLSRGVSRAPYAQVWARGIREPYLPQKKMNFGLAEMQSPAVLRGLLYVVVSKQRAVLP